MSSVIKCQRDIIDMMDLECRTSQDTNRQIQTGETFKWKKRDTQTITRFVDQ